jgi:hypothetical protein
VHGLYSSEPIFFVLIFLRTLLHQCFRQLLCNHILPHSLRKTPGVGIPPKICFVFSSTYELFTFQPRDIPLSHSVLRRIFSPCLCVSVAIPIRRRRPVGVPLFSNGKRSLSLFRSYRCRTLSFPTRGGTPPPPVSLPPSRRTLSPQRAPRATRPDGGPIFRFLRCRRSLR